MDLAELLRFVPLIIGALLVYNLVVRQDLPSKSLGEVFTYFIGIIIVFLAVSWLITTFLADWATDLLQAGNSSEWQLFIDESGGVVEGTFGGDGTAGGPVPQPQPTVVRDNTMPPIVVTATPNGNSNARPESVDNNGNVQYTVANGDTLFSIANRYNTTVNDIMIVNGLTTTVIQPGQVLRIPASR